MTRLTASARRPARRAAAAVASAVLAVIGVVGLAGPAVARVSAYSGQAEALAAPAHPACPNGGGSRFADVPGSNVHAAAIRCVALWDVARGRTAESYAPSAPVTRAQMASFVFRLLAESGGTLPAAGSGTFRDLPSGGTHTVAIETLAAAGIVEGLTDGRYQPDETVTRAQTASLLVRVFEYRTGSELPTAGDAFADDAGSVHERSIDKAAAAGFASGRAAGRFAPAAAVRRDQMASFVSRVLDRLVVDGRTPAVDGRIQLCYSSQPDLSGGRPLQGATLRGEVYMYTDVRC